jgi:methyl-accepting chemotaxis protein
MARTKAQMKKNALRAKRGNELAAIAQCMDGYLRDQNQQLSEANEWLRKRMKLQQDKFEKAINKVQRNSVEMRRIAYQRFHERELAYQQALQRRDRRIRELEQQWEDMADTLHETINEIDRLRERNRNMEEQLLDISDAETEIDTTLSDNE